MRLALAHDALLPRPPGGQGAGAALSLLVHAGLVAALTVSIDWRNQTPEVFSAEIWASVPQTAAPPPVEAPAPPPAPPPRVAAPPAPDADIAIEHERERKRKADAERKLAEAEKKKADAERKLAEAQKKKLEEQKQAEAQRRLAEQQAREARAEDERLARLREENLKRMMGQAGGTTGGSAGGTTGGSAGGSTGGTAARSAGPSATYAGQVRARVRPNIVFAGTVTGNPAAEVEVTTASGGTIIARRLVKSSGQKEWDEAVLRAIDRTPSLPRDSDGRVPQTIIIEFRPE